MKRMVAFLLAAAILIGVVPMMEVKTMATTSLPDGIYLTQAGKTTCTLCSAAMMLRARMYLSGNGSWASVTESSIKSAAWIDGTGLRWAFTYRFGDDSMTVAHKGTSGLSVSELKAILDSHPEGIVLYCGNVPHAVFLTDYEGDTFYCADPYAGYDGGRISLDSSYLGIRYGTQAGILSRVTAYWYISSYEISSEVGGNVDSCGCSTEYAGTYTCATGGYTLTIRSGHGTSYGAIGSIPDGATVTVTKASGSDSGDWAHVSYNGITGYASMAYLQKLEEEPGNTPVDFGTGFYAVILNQEYWKPISNDPDSFVRLQSEDGTSSQVWRFDRQEDGSYLITSARNGYALEMHASDTSNGNPAAAWSEDLGGSNQRWFIYQEDDGYILNSTHVSDENMVLALENDSSADGTAIVTKPRTNESTQIWAIYREDSVQLKEPELSVKAGDSAVETTFTWDGVYGESGYTVKIWNGTELEGEPSYEAYDVASGWSIQLPLGTYVAYVGAYNHYESRMSNVVTFTITEHQHTYSDWQTVKEPTCTQEGEEQRDCTVCEAAEVQSVPAHGHSYGVWDLIQEPTCTEPGQEKRTCAHCDYFETQPVAENGHAYVGRTTTPTCTEDGFTTYTCEHCGDSYVADYVEAIGHSYVDGTCEHCGAVEIILGDVNGDGKVDTTDAKIIMQYDLGMLGEEALMLAAADVNGDGKVDTTDAKIIMQKDLGLITDFPKAT